MISVVLFIVGGCHQQAVIQKQVVQQVVAQQVAYVPAVSVAPLVQTYGVVDPYWAPRDNSAQRIEQLLQLAEKQAATIEKLTAGKQVSEPCDDCQAQSKPASDSIATQARAILERSCVTCHSGAEPKGGLDLTGTLTTGERLLVSDAISTGSMPPPPKEALSDTDSALIYTWAHQDKEAVRSLLRSK